MDNVKNLLTGEWLNRILLGVCAFFLINGWNDLAVIKDLQMDIMVKLGNDTTQIQNLDRRMESLEARMREQESQFMEFYKQYGGVQDRK